MIKKTFYMIVIVFMIMIYAITQNSYTGYAKFSDWRGKQCDFATNKIVHNYYNDAPSLWFRSNKTEDWGVFKKAIEKGETVRVGLDYYALTGVCNGIIPKKILESPEVYYKLTRGEVIVLKMMSYGSMKDGNRVSVEYLIEE